ncbi:MAG TPA: hypothetical protein VEC12_08590 [Bacteroidia bacterium]|nr:hypothetical protein [Bacteroidia bacterium]
MGSETKSEEDNYDSEPEEESQLSNEEFNLLREEYLRGTFKWFEYTTAEFDKGVFYVATGSLGLSLTFIEKFISPDIQHDWLIITSWVLHTGTIFLFVVNHYLSSKSLSFLVSELPTKVHKPKSSKIRGWVSFLNWVCIICLLLGLICLIFFVYFNLDMNGKFKGN